MLHEFLSSNRTELIRRCESKVALRSLSRVSPLELEHGVPRFLEQLVEQLRYEEANPEPEIKESKDNDGSAEALLSATLDGDQSFEHGYSVGQVVHGYGDVCQVITTLAIETHETVTLREFRTLNRLLDHAIADAVSSFRRSETSAGEQGAHDLHHQLGVVAEEQRQLLDRALMALAAVKFGNVGLTGATGTVLEESLKSLRVLIDKSLPEIRLATGMTTGLVPTPDRRALAPGRRLSDTPFAAVRKSSG